MGAADAHADLPVYSFWGVGITPGVTVDARVDGKACDATVSSDGGVWLVVVSGASTRPAEVGSVVTFTVDGAQAPETFTLVSGGAFSSRAVELTLTVGGQANSNLVIFAGGTVDDLVSTLRQQRGISFWATVGGNLIGYTIGAPTFVNASFTSAFPGGVIPANTPLIVLQRPGSKSLPNTLRASAGVVLIHDAWEVQNNDIAYLIFEDAGDDIVFSLGTNEAWDFSEIASTGEFSYVMVAFDYDGDSLGDVALYITADGASVIQWDTPDSESTVVTDQVLVGVTEANTLLAIAPSSAFPAGEAQVFVVGVWAFDQVCDGGVCLTQLVDNAPDDETVVVRFPTKQP
jgi:hypothetical protein